MPSSLKRSSLVDSFFKEKAKPPATPPATTGTALLGETLSPEPSISAEESEQPSFARLVPLLPAFDFPDQRHLQPHFETLAQEETLAFSELLPSFSSQGELSDEAKEWQHLHFIPFMELTRKDPRLENIPLTMRSYLNRLQKEKNWRYFLEHLGDFSSEENLMIRTLLKEKFDLTLLLTHMDEKNWEGFLDVVKYQPWFREKIIRNGFDLESLMLDFPQNSMKVLKAFKDNFIKTSTQNLSQLNALLKHLSNSKEREDLLFKQLGIEHLCSLVKNATQLASFLKMLNEDEFKTFLKQADHRWVESVLGSTHGVASALEQLKKTAEDDFDRQKAFLDHMGGLDWLKDCVFYDRFRDLPGLAALFRALSKEQMLKLLISKIGLANLPYVTADYGTMLLVLHGVPEGMQADLALALIRENVHFGLVLIQHYSELLSLLELIPEEKEQMKFLAELCAIHEEGWLVSLLPTLSALTKTLAVVSTELQAEILTKIGTPQLLALVKTLDNEQDLVILWKALPKDLSFARFFKEIGPEKLELLFEKIPDEQKSGLLVDKSVDELADILHYVPQLIGTMTQPQTFLWNKITTLEQLVQIVDALPVNKRAEFTFSSEGIKNLQKLISKDKEASKATASHRSDPGKLFSATHKEAPTKAALKSLEKLFPKLSDKKKLSEAVSNAPFNLKAAAKGGKTKNQ